VRLHAIRRLSKSTAPSAATNEKKLKEVTMEDIVSLCKKRGFVFQSNDIYSALSGFYDYGPLGVEMKNNIKNIWWRDFVRRREDVVGIDTAIISPSKLWEASGHVEGFSDPMVIG
jgi:glycyl-tRNA synthetase